MITFTDEREADLWRAVYAPMVATLRECAPDDSMNARTMLAGEYADAAVLEYRKRCAQSESSQYRPRPRAEWRECDGPALWWAPYQPFPLLRGEDEYLPDEYTMWTPLPPAPTEWPGSENDE